MPESAHVIIMITLVKQRLKSLDAENASHLPQPVQDAITHEYANLLELQDWLANHFQ